MLKDKIPFLNNYTAPFKTLGFYGCGNMGEAILKGLVNGRSNRPVNINIVGRSLSRLGYLEKNYTVNTSNSPTILNDCEVIILGFKPQNLEDISEIKCRGKIIISMLAGVKLEKIKETFVGGRYVRVMPNLGHFEGKGMTGIYYGSKFTKKDKEAVSGIFEESGTTLEVKKEETIDPLGAISGCGPAYYFYFTEMLTQAAVKLGFSPDDAEVLARETLIGAAAVMENNPDDSAAEWREKVTSKKGVTEQALLSFKKDKLGKIIETAVKKAEAKSIEFGK